MSALMSDVITGSIAPDVAKTAVGAGCALIKVVEMQMKYGAGQSGEALQLTSPAPTPAPAPVSVAAAVPTGTTKCRMRGCPIPAPPEGGYCGEHKWMVIAPDEEEEKLHGRKTAGA